MAVFEEVTARCCAMTSLLRGSVMPHLLEEPGVAEEHVDDVLVGGVEEKSSSSDMPPLRPT